MTQAVEDARANSGQTAGDRTAADALDTGLLSLCGIAAFFRIAADAEKLHRELSLHGRFAAADDLVRASRLIGL